jgi:hypothetical protein
MRSVLLSSLSIAAVSCLVLTPCAADTVYSNFGPGQSVDSHPTSGWCVSGDTTPFCGPLTDRWIAAPFTSAGTFTLTEIDLALVLNTSPFPPPTLSLLSAGGVELVSGTQYWLIAEGTTPSSADFWYGSPNGATGTLLSLNDGATWINPGLFPNPPDPSNGNLPAFDVLGNPIAPLIIAPPDPPPTPTANGALIELVNSSDGQPGTIVLESWLLSPAQVPEPCSFTFLAVGLASLFVGTRVRRTRS